MVVGLRAGLRHEIITPPGHEITPPQVQIDPHANLKLGIITGDRSKNRLEVPQ
jgi:hypothetical protein